MPLTPSDVEQMTFSTALRGYDLDEVDDFLDQVVVAIRDLMDELAERKSRASDLERASGDSPAGADEAAVGRALVAAQQAGDKIIEDAEAEAEAILETARTEAESFEAERKQMQEQAEAEMAEHSERVAEVRTQLALLATQVADKLDEMDAVITEESEADHDEPQSEDEQGREEDLTLLEDDDLIGGEEADDSDTLGDSSDSGETDSASTDTELVMDNLEEDEPASMF